MKQIASSDHQINLHVKNVGGITETEVEISPGLTILSGQNATNRTSLLQAFMTALGSDRTPLKADADEGRVELAIADQVYTRTVSRQNGTIVAGGDPYLDDSTIADLFAFLLESNEARRAVARADDLRNIIMRPIDTDDIESRIRSLQNEQNEIEQKIENIESLKQKLIELEATKSELSSKINKKESSLADIKEKIEEKDRDVEGEIKENKQLENELDGLRNVQSRLERVRDQINTEKDSIDALNDEKRSIESELSDLDPIPEAKLTEIDDEITRLRSRRADIDESLEELQTVIRFNQDLLKNDRSFLDELEEDEKGTTESAVTEGLFPSDDLICWTCGSDITNRQVENMIEEFQDLHSRYMSKRSEIDDQISSLTTERDEVEEQQQQREQLQSRLSQIDNEVEDSRRQLSELQNRRDEFVSKVETLESNIEELRSSEDHNELIRLHKKANELEVEINRLETDFTDVTTKIEQVETEIAGLEKLQNEHDEVQAEIKELRTKIDRIEEEAVDTFNTHMDEVLNILEYENLDRIWLERTERDEHDGRKSVKVSEFELHIIRSTSDGTVFEDDISHLSESEREVTGLIFALAGYLAHDFHEDCPFMLIDSIEAIDVSRLISLVDYLKEYPTYLIVALLEQDAQELSETYERVTDI